MRAMVSPSDRDSSAPSRSDAAVSAAGTRHEDRDAQKLLRLLVDTVQDYAIFVLDPDGYVLTWNPGAERIKGYTADQIIGRHFSTFYPQADIDRGKPPWELVVAAREGRFEDEDWRLRSDGTPFWANVVITALRDDNGELVGFAKVTRDLTERRAAEQRALEDTRLLAEAEAANRAKSEFLATMSHELRTPLNAIGGYVDLLLMGIRGAITEQQREDLQRIRRSQQHLLAIINDLLNFTRLEAGHVVYELVPIRMVPIIREVGAMIEPQANVSGVELRWDACQDVSGLADESKLEQILINLLTNAVKFTPPGGSVSVSCETVDDDTLSVSVIDTGIGIDADKLETIFEPFVQIGRSLSSAHEGTGLGLAISRDLARGMGGDLTARSEQGVGSTFTLTLPRERS